MTLTELPLLANGKPDRQSLHKQVPTKMVGPTYCYPRDPIETRLARLWQDLFQTSPIGIDDDFFDLGGDSLTAVQLFTELEGRFGLDLDPGMLLEAPTVRLIAPLLRLAVQDTGLHDTVSLNSNCDGPKIFCFPAVDGYAFVFRPVARRLEGQHPLVAVTYPGLSGNAAPPTTVEDLASALLETLRAEQPTGPYYLVGHSFGGTVAFEIAHQLSNLGENVAFLGLFDSHAPGATPWIARRVRDCELAFAAAQATWRSLQTHRPFQRIVRWCSRLGKIAVRGIQRRRKTLIEHRIHNVRTTNLQALARYRGHSGKGVEPTSSILFRANPEKPQPTHWQRFADPENGWRSALPNLRVVSVLGDHIDMLAEPRVRGLAQALNEAIKSTAQSTTPSTENDRQSSSKAGSTL